MSADIYGESYYRSHLATGRTDLAYERNEHWLTFFGGVAERIVTTLRPTTVLDAGCAIGMLVEALRERGVDASGVDLSDWAIAHAHESVTDHVRVGSLTEPIDGRFDLVTCIEVLEHLPASEVDKAILNLTSITDRLLISSTPEDFEEPTHLNVQPPEYWAGKLAELGFHRDLDYDASFLTPWAVLFRRSGADPAGLVRSYERDRWNLVRERDALRQTTLEHHRATATGPSPAGTQEVRDQLRDALDAARAADASRASAESRLRGVEYALAASQAREAEVAELFDRIYELTSADRARLEAIARARTFRIYWKLLAPYRRFRGSE